MGPIVALAALCPFVAVGLCVVIDLVAMGAVLVFLVAKSAGVAEVLDFALDLAVSPEGRIGRVTVGALVIVQARAGIARLLLVGGVGGAGGAAIGRMRGRHGGGGSIQ